MCIIDRLLIEIVNAIAMPESFYAPSFINFVSCDGETVTLHATPVLCDIILAVLLRVGGVREEHTLIAGSLFVFAHAAWLD